MSKLHIHCPHFDICSGCVHNEQVDNLPILDEVRQFFKDNGVQFFKLQTGHPTGWRCRAKLAVRGTSAMPLIGLFEKGSHKTVNIPECRVHHPAINHAIEILRKWIIQFKIQPYDEVSHAGLLRYVQAGVESETGKIQLTLVLNVKTLDKKTQESLEALWSFASDLWHSLWINLNTRHDNIIFESNWIHIKGSFWLIEALNGQKIYFHPASFMQANMEMFSCMVQCIESLLPEKADLIEFYAGVGAIGAAVVKKCEQIQCIELNPIAEQCFEETRRHLPFELAERLSFHQGKSSDFLRLLNNLDPSKGVVLVDPPRKGLEKALLKVFCDNNCINNLIYVSCGWLSFQFDCKILLKAGWRLVHAEAFLFFPGSEHIEILAAFKR